MKIFSSEVSIDEDKVQAVKKRSSKLDYVTEAAKMSLKRLSIKENSEKFDGLSQTSLLSDSPKYNTLIIKGQPRQGKTALLKELIEGIIDVIPVHKIFLNVYDQKVNF